MKHLFFFSTFFIAQLCLSQSMIVLKNGIVLTIDDEGSMSDQTHFMLPYQIKKLSGRYLVSEDKKLQAVDSRGSLYMLEDKKLPKMIAHYGENYFISKLGKPYVLDAQGKLTPTEKEREFRHVKMAGGTFLIAEKKLRFKKFLSLFTFTKQGTIVEATAPDLDLALVNHVGGKYFTTKKGELFTVSTEGDIYSKKDVGFFRGWEFLKGSNYFFANGSLYTVSEAGALMSVAMANDFGKLSYLGTNFFITTKGALFTVSHSGNVRSIPFNYKLSDISQFSHM